MKATGAATIVIVLTTATLCAACPVCDTETGREVREGIFTPGFTRNVVAVLSPFLILLGVIGAIHFGHPSARLVSRQRTRKDDRAQ